MAITDLGHHQWDEISPGIRDMIYEVYTRPDLYEVNQVKKRFGRTRDLSAICSDGYVWFGSERRSIRGMYDVYKVTPLVFAKTFLSYRFFAQLLSSSESVKGISEPITFYQVFMEGATPKTLLLKGDRFAESPIAVDTVEKDDFFEKTKLLDYKNYSPVPLLFKLSGGRKMPLKVFSALVEKCDDILDRGWIRDIKPVCLQIAVFFDPVYELDFSNSTDKNNVSLLPYLIYLKKTNYELFKRVVDTEFFWRLLISVATVSPGIDSTKNLKTIYEDSFSDENVLWDLMIHEHLMSTTLGDPDDPDQMIKYIHDCWTAITGKKLYFDIEGYKHYKTDWDVVELYSMDIDLLRRIIKGSDGVIYPKIDPEEYRKGVNPISDIVNPFYKVLDSSSDLILEALEKDFIRKKSVNESIEYLILKGKKSMIPALLLKLHGQWPEIRRENE